MSIYAEGRWDQVNMPFVADYRVSFEKANVVLEGGVVTVYPYEGDAFKADITPADMYMKEIEYITDIFVSGQPNLQNPPESAAESIRLAATLKQSADNGGQTLPF